MIAVSLTPQTNNNTNKHKVIRERGRHVLCYSRHSGNLETNESFVILTSLILRAMPFFECQKKKKLKKTTQQKFIGNLCVGLPI